MKRASGTTLVYHVAAFSVCAYFLYRAEELFGSPHANLLAFGGRYAFLTQLTHTALTGYFAFLILYDLYHLPAQTSGNPKVKKMKRKQARGSRHSLNRLNDYLFVLLFVFTSLVGLMFWGLFFYDQELILPKSVQAFYPQDLNLFQHGAVMVLMWLEVILCAHKNRSALAELLVVLLFGLLYLVWTFVLVHLNDGRWPYAFQKDMDLQGHAAFNLVGAVLIAVAFLTARGLRSVLNSNSNSKGNNATTKSKTKKSKQK